MSRWLVAAGFTLLLGTLSLQAQEGLRRGKIKKIELDRRILSLVVDGKDEEAQYQGPVFGGNRYSGSAIFGVPKAALTGESTDIWEWNDRADIDLAKWRSLGKL